MVGSGGRSWVKGGECWVVPCVGLVGGWSLVGGYRVTGGCRVVVGESWEKGGEYWVVRSDGGWVVVGWWWVVDWRMIVG